MRSVPLTLVLALVLPGCLDALGGADVQPSSIDVAAPAIVSETAVLTTLPGAVHAAWTGRVKFPDAPVATPSDVPTFVEHALTLPAEVTMVRAWLNWSDERASLGFRLFDDERRASWCGVPSTRTVPATCFATFYDARELAGDAMLRVSATGHTATPPVPVEYTLEAIFSAAPLPLLGAPAPFGDAAPVRFAAPTLVSEEARSAEPSIAVTPAGTLYVAAPTGPQGTLWRSTDDGATFQPILIHGQATDPMSAYTTGGGDSDVAVVGEDTIYFTDQQGGNGQTVSASHDGGKTWWTNIFAAGPPVGADRQWLVTDGPQTVWLAFNGRSLPAVGGEQGPLGRATVTKSLDGGRTWPLRTFVEGDACFRGNLFRDPAGTLYLAGCNSAGPGVAVSTDGGLDFRWKNVAERSGETNTSFFYVGHLFVVGTSDEAGNVHVVWVDPSPSDLDTPNPDGVQLNVWVASSSDQGGTWSAPVRVNERPGTYVLPWITAGKDGRLAIAYMGTSYVGHPERALGEWYPILSVSDDGGKTWSGSAMTESFYQYGPICMRGSSCGNSRNLLDFFQIQADATGRIHAAFTDGLLGGNARLSKIMYVHSADDVVGGPSVDKSGGKHGATMLLPGRLGT